MRVKKLSKGFVLLSLAVAATLAVYPLFNAACAPAPSVHSAAHGPSPAVASDVITEWNQQAVSLTLATASALSPVEQTRVMAIFQLAVHDAVNGITGEYETYLSPTGAPENASAEAAAIAEIGRAHV